jgi:hypothetical protein
MTMDMRHIMEVVSRTTDDPSVLLESTIIGYINSRFSNDGTPDVPVIEVRSRSHLNALLAKHESMRAAFEGDYLAMWDGMWATHRNYEDQLGGSGWRIDFTRRDHGFSVGYNIYDCTPSKLKRSTLFKKLFTTEELKSMDFTANEV